jgi:hypothetical protein
MGLPMCIPPKTIVFCSIENEYSNKIFNNDDAISIIRVDEGDSQEGAGINVAARHEYPPAKNAHSTCFAHSRQAPVGTRADRVGFFEAEQNSTVNPQWFRL